MFYKMTKYIIPFLCLFLFFSSCQEMNLNTFFKKTHINKQLWKGEEPLTFDIKLEDISYPYYISMYFLHDDNYPYSNLWFELSVYEENDSIPFKSQRFEVNLADKMGEWYGSGTKDLVEHRIPIGFKKPLEFTFPGKYRFEVKHLMRTDPLPMVSAGILLEKGKRKINIKEEEEELEEIDLQNVTWLINK